MKLLMNQINYKFTGLDDFQKILGNPDKPMYEKCRLFLESFVKAEPDWSFPIYANDAYNKDVDKMANFINRESKHVLLKKKRKGDDQTLKTLDRNALKNNFFELCDRTLKTDQAMADAIQLFRVYANCYFLNDSLDATLVDLDLFNTLSRKFFPYLRFNFPLFEIYNASKPIDESLAEVVKFNNGLPEFAQNTFTGNVLSPKNDENLMQFYYNTINGRGIVLTATARHTKDIVRLIRVLRALNNELPIQIVYRGQLSNRSKKAILKSAFEDFKDLNSSSLNLETILPHIDLIRDAEMYDIAYPKQQVSFMNLKPLVSDNSHFQGYNNKVLALLFSSFQETILLDADTVPLLSLVAFFESPEYLETRTMFFKDRSLRDTNDYLETNFYKKLMPMDDRVNSLDKLLGLPLIDHSVFHDNNYMRGFRHYQEAGAVVIDKKMHFKGLLMTLPLSVWKEPVKTSVWGDKEFYWLGLLMSGDSNFKFNKYESAAVGTMSPDSHKSYRFGQYELCSSHPGHVNSQGELMWINSGFSFCKKNNFYRDKDRYPFSKLSSDEIADMYKNPVKITHALVPPSLPDIRSVDSSRDNDFEKEVTFLKSWKTRDPDIDEIEDYGIKKEFTPKLDYYPQKGWVKSAICQGYQYCAYDEIQSYGKGTQKGTVFKFDQETVNKFDYLSKIWITGKV